MRIEAHKPSYGWIKPNLLIWLEQSECSGWDNDMFIQSTISMK